MTLKEEIQKMVRQMITVPRIELGRLDRLEEIVLLLAEKVDTVYQQGYEHGYDNGKEDANNKN